MKNFLFIGLIVFSTAIYGQEAAPADTLESRAAIPIDMSDYNKNSLNFSWGLRAGISKTRINTTTGNVIQITPNGTPVVSSTGVVRDELVSSTAFGNGFQGTLFGRIGLSDFK